MSIPVVRDHTDAVIAALETAGLVVGDGVAPDADPPHVTVYAISSVGFYGRLGVPNDDATLAYQVTCTGKSREQADWLADKVAITLLAGLSVTGRHIANVDNDLSPGIQRDDAQTPPVFYAVPRFRVMTTPA